MSTEFVAKEFEKLRRDIRISAEGVRTVHASAFAGARRRRGRAVALTSLCAVTIVAVGIGGVVSSGIVGPRDDMVTAVDRGSVGMSGVQGSPGAYADAAVTQLSKESSFVGSAYGEHRDLIVVYGTGEATALFHKLATGAPDGLMLRWQSVPFSLAEINAAQEQILSLYPEVEAVALGANFASLDASISGSSSAARALEMQIEAWSDIPVAVNNDGGAIPPRDMHG